MTLYNVDFHCPRCGKIHGVYGGPGCGLQMQDGPTREGTIAELYAGRRIPEVLTQLLNDKVWCEDTQDAVIIADPARVTLRPKPPYRSDV